MSDEAKKGDEKLHCFNCGKELDKTHYCYGCHKAVCEDCDTASPFGPHVPEDHLGESDCD